MTSSCLRPRCTLRLVEDEESAPARYFIGVLARVGPERSCMRNLPPPSKHLNLSRVQLLHSIEHTSELAQQHQYQHLTTNDRESHHQTITISRNTRHASEEGGSKHLREGDQGGSSDA